MKKVNLLLFIILLFTSIYTMADERTHHLDHRMAAFHRTLAYVNEVTGNTGIAVYGRRDGNYGEVDFLSKLVSEITIDNKTYKFSDGKDLKVEDFPGGVNISFIVGGVEVTFETMPLLVGRGNDPEAPWEGAALFKAYTSPPANISLSIGGARPQTHGPPPDLMNYDIPPLRSLKKDGNRAIYKAGEMVEYFVSLKSSANIEKINVKEGEALVTEYPDGEGWLKIAYAVEEQRAEHLVGQNAENAERVLHDYYQELLSPKIITPDKVINDAFRSAIYNLEYNWIEPYGWNECIHHWHSFWHNQHSAAAEWLGQADRSRECALVHAENTFPDGAIPQFHTSGITKRDFGGSNQFWAWQLRHYWHFTGDMEFAETVAPVLENMLHQTLEEHDPDGNLLIGWGLQIGNQEDFIEFPNDGATPTIELVNMMRTRVELAEALGNEVTAKRWKGKIERSLSNLKDKLWLDDLGRLGYWRDLSGKIRLEGQYHTFLYPLLYDIFDELDAYPAIRHVYDRLTGIDGEVYCSNNFPNHNIGTWGMQAGAAQQPWAAWTYSKAGLRNRTYKPLKAVSEWVMNDAHRGAWPEVSIEHTPAYFTPPAGLFIASVIEALFGLELNKPEQTLGVAPSFPDHWPEASIELPEFSAQYDTKGNRLFYHVKSEKSLKRDVKWSLPPGNVLAFKVNDKSHPFEVEKGIERSVLSAFIKAEKDTRIEIEFEPTVYNVQHPGSIAEGEQFSVEIEGAKLKGIEDRLGILSSFRQVDSSKTEITLKEGLLDAYLPYGRLGLANFSRRTFFLDLEGAEGVNFWYPIDITVLPPVEAVSNNEIKLEAGEISIPVDLRNNTRHEQKGIAWLHTIGMQFKADVSIPPRDQIVTTFKIPQNLLTLFSKGDNNANIVFPDGSQVDITLSIVEPFHKEPGIENYSLKRFTSIPLSNEDKMPYERWSELREGSHAGPMPWPGWVPPLQGMEHVTKLDFREIPGLEFSFDAGQMALVGERIGRSQLEVNVQPRLYRKFYILLASFVDNHDIFSRLGFITLRNNHGVIASRELYMPGDVDWWEHNGMLETMGTARFERLNRFGLLPILKPEQSDWSNVSPPDFPQPQYWASSRVLHTENCTFNVVEIDLGENMTVDRLSLHADGICPGFGIMGIVGEVPVSESVLENTRWLPPVEFRTPDVLWVAGPDTRVNDWEFYGEAFSLSGVYGERSLNSLTARGESAIGRTVSPVFYLDPKHKSLEIKVQGGHNQVVDGKDNLYVEVIDAKTGKTLKKLIPPGSHHATTRKVSLSNIDVEKIQIVVVDNNDDNSYAWIGLESVKAYFTDK